MRHTDFAHEQQIVRRPHAVAPTLGSVNVRLIVHSKQPPAIGSGAGLTITSLMTAQTLRDAGVDCEVWSLPDAEALKANLSQYSYASLRQITHVVINTPS